MNAHHKPKYRTRFENTLSEWQALIDKEMRISEDLRNDEMLKSYNIGKNKILSILNDGSYLMPVTGETITF